MEGKDVNVRNTNRMPHPSLLIRKKFPISQWLFPSLHTLTLQSSLGTTIIHFYLASSLHQSTLDIY